ncbi:MAG: GDP-mannose 4,6-dehydratase [Pseudomonadota bacterium]
MGKSALVTGITGQDGAYLAALLLRKGYHVFGTYRQKSITGFWRLKELGLDRHDDITLLEHDITDFDNTVRILQKYQPIEVYNLAAQSFVQASFGQPVMTAEVTGISVLKILEAIRTVDKNIRFFQASTSEMFGKALAVPQTETTPFVPKNPYGVAKVFAHWTTINHRETYGLFATSGILYNHESPLRGKEYVTRKITDAVARIKLGTLDRLELGNLDARRDWGYAEDYVEGMWLMLQADEPDTFVLSTNKTTTVRSFVEMCFKAAGIDISWKGEGLNEVGSDGIRDLIVINPNFYRPTETELLIGDASKADKTLGWKSKTSVETLCSMMIQRDIERNDHRN